MRIGMIFIFSLLSFCFVTNGYAEPKNDTGIHTKLGQPCDPKTFDAYCDGDLLVKCSRNTITATNCAMKKDGDFICADYSDDVLKCKKGDRDCNRAKMRIVLRVFQRASYVISKERLLQRVSPTLRVKRIPKSIRVTGRRMDSSSPISPKKHRAMMDMVFVLMMENARHLSLVLPTMNQIAITILLIIAKITKY